MKVYINYNYDHASMVGWASKAPEPEGGYDFFPYYHAFEFNVPNDIDIEEAIECECLEDVEKTALGQYLKRIGFDVTKNFTVDEDKIPLAVNKYAQSIFSNLPGVIKVVINE